MIITLRRDIGSPQLEKIVSLLEMNEWSATRVTTQSNSYLVAIGKKEIDIRTIGKLDGVTDVHQVTDAFKLVSRQWKVEPSLIDLGDGVVVGEGGFSIMAGPCSIEGEEQVRSIVNFLAGCGVKIMRGGVFKPRTSPYTFRGMGIEGLKLFSSIAHEKGIKIITEVLEISQIEQMVEYVDMFQVGARNSQNFNLLHELGNVDKPVMIKRGISGTLEELLQSAEYVFANGNEKLLLCERGIRGYEKSYRNILDLNAVPFLKEKSHLPVIVDPSHGIGIRRFVPSMTLAAVMAGADGCIVEVHETPEKALSDGAQTLNFMEAEGLFSKVGQTFALREG